MKTSAVLDVPREHVHYLPADHRHLCKFATPEDPSYGILRQALLSTVADIESTDVSRQEAKNASDMSRISHALSQAERPTRDLSAAVSKLHRGSCSWLTESNHFQDWTSFGDDTEVDDSKPGPKDEHARILWLNGPPGSGKSVSAGHVIQFLQRQNLDCSYFFIKGNSVDPLTRLLLSLAFQMAESNYDARMACLEMLEKGTPSLEDPSLTWTSLFLIRIFKLAFCQPQFWVIDGLDELPPTPLSSLIQMLAEIESSVPLRIFVTSRPHVPIQLRFREEGKTWTELHTGQSGSMDDIAAFVDSKIKFTLGDDEQREELIRDTVRKSQGNFLWASLIIDRIKAAYSIEDMKIALQQAPSEMIGVYGKMLDKIKVSESASLSKCILEWMVCAPRRLQAEELRKMVFLDIKRTLASRPTGPNAIFTEICGNFITVDAEGSVQLMHQTAKEFLTSEDSGFYVDERMVHERHAAVCLVHLDAGKSSSRPVRRRPISSALSRQDDSVFDDYAYANFAYHLAHCHSEDSRLFKLLEAFFERGVLAWVERVARTGKLGSILTAVENLKPYLARQLDRDRDPDLDSRYNGVKEMLHDLTRIVTLFGSNLIESPSSIHSIIPPLCPTSSMIHKAFAKRSRCRVICDSNDHWSERIAEIFFFSGPDNISVNDRYLAAGDWHGIEVFDQSTLEKVTTLSHIGDKRRVAWGNITPILASWRDSGGDERLFLWNSNFTRRWKIPVPDVVDIHFSPDDSLVYAAVNEDSKAKAIIAFRTSDGSEVAAFSTRGYGLNSNHDSPSPPVVRLSPILGLAAVANYGSHVTISTLHELDGLEEITTFRRAGFENATRPPIVLDITFNSNMESDLMAVSYRDDDNDSGQIITVEIGDWSARQRNSYPFKAHTLASSPNGQTLAAGGDSEHGDICLFAFDTLQLLHRISTGYGRVEQIVCAPDGLRLFELRHNSCYVWEPAVLARQSSTDDASTNPAAISPEVTVGAANVLEARPRDYTDDNDAMTTGAGGEFILRGHMDGSVSVRHLETGRVVLRIKCHHSEPEILIWKPGQDILMSVDSHGSWEMRRLAFTSSGASVGEETLMERRVQSEDRGYHRVLSWDNPSRFSVLITSHGGETLVQDGKVVDSTYSDTYEERAWSPKSGGWLQHPTDANRLLLVGWSSLHIFNWESLRRETPEAGIPITFSDSSEISPDPFMWDSAQDLGLLVQASSGSFFGSTDNNTTSFKTLDVSKVSPSTSSVPMAITTLDFNINLILEVHRSTMYFIGLNYWLCSFPIGGTIVPDEKTDVLEEDRYNPPFYADGSGGPIVGHYTRHFFVPPFWRRRRGIRIKVIPETGFVGLAYEGELIIISGALDDGEKIPFSIVQVRI